MNVQELARVYQRIGERLQAREEYPHRLLGADYCYVADLIRAPRRDVPHLVGELRANLSRARRYRGAEKRNATLHVMASALERIGKQGG